MGEFFRGWRRKAGFATLSMACVFAAVWMRSEGTVYIVASREKGIPLSFISGCGEFAFVGSGYFGIRCLDYENGTNPEFYFSYPVRRRGRRTEILRESWEAHKLKVFRQDFPRATAISENFTQITTVPCWSIVLPMTMLSAWLLLSKPRPKKSAEST